ncbi:MAG TPA: hypothetical protein VGE40_05590 [Bacilli bacterium]
MIVYDNERKMINSELPINVRSHLVSGIFTGYELVKQLVKETPWLQNAFGRNNYGSLRNSAVSFALKQKIVQEHFQVGTEEKMNRRRNYGYLQLNTPSSIIDICQVAHPLAVPRHADFRFENSFNNEQIEFIDENGKLILKNYMDVEPKNSSYYMILTHGCEADEPSFIRIGVPELGVKKWMYQLDLLSEPRLVKLPTKEEILTTIPKFKEHILKGVQGDGQKL